MKKKVVVVTVAILAIVVWFYIMGLSAHLDCSQTGPITQTHGLCFWRRLGEICPFVVYLFAWTWLGGVVAKAKGRHQAIGWVLGFFLQFLGALILLIMEQKLTPEEKSKRELRKKEEKLEREMRKKYEKLKITWNEPKK